MNRDYRDALIEDLVDRELVMRYHQRLVLAMLINRLNALRADADRLQKQLEAVRAEIRRYTARAVREAA